MADTKVKTIVVKSTNYKYEDCDFSNRKLWDIHRIFEEVYFNCDEDDRKKIEADVAARGDAKFFQKYLDAFSKVSILKKDRLTYFHGDLNRFYDDGKEEKFFMRTDEAAYAHYADLFEKSGIYDIIDIVKTQEEAIAVLMVAPWVEKAVKSAPAAYIDTNLSRKGGISRQAYMKDLRERLLEIFKNEFSQNRSKALTKEIINYYESLPT